MSRADAFSRVFYPILYKNQAKRGKINAWKAKDKEPLRNGPSNNLEAVSWATDTGQLKLCTLFAEEFIHRFLQHVLPKGFVKVRYFGFFAPGCRKRLLALRLQLEHNYPQYSGQPETAPTHAAPIPKLCCSSCGQPLLFQRTIQPTGRCPP